MDLPTLPPSTILGPELRVAVGVVAVVLLLQGARFYRVAVVAPGVLGGLAGGLALARQLHLARDASIVIACVLALAGGLICHLGERLAVTVGGVLAGIALTIALEPLVAGGLPWWAPVVGAALGGLASPILHRALLPVLTAVVAAPAVAWVIPWPMTAPVLLGLTAFGIIVQLMTGGSPASKGSTKGD